jgi:hypothetical protein
VSDNVPEEAEVSDDVPEKAEVSDDVPEEAEVSDDVPAADRMLPVAVLSVGTISAHAGAALSAIVRAAVPMSIFFAICKRFFIKNKFSSRDACRNLTCV